MFFPKVVLTAMLSGLMIGHAANAGGPALSFTFQEMRPVTPRAARVVISVLPETRHLDRNTNMSGIVTIAHNRETHAAVALFTIFDCGRHQFQIQMVGRVTIATDKTFTVVDLAAPSATDLAMSPVAASPWGPAVEQVACKPD